MRSGDTKRVSETAGERSVRDSLGFLWRSMEQRRRLHFCFVLLVLLLGTLAELMTIGAVLPFLAILSDPAAGERIFALRWLAEVTHASDHAQLTFVAALLLVFAGVATALVRLLLTWVTLAFVLTLSHEVGASVFARMLRQPYAYYVQRNTSELISGVEKVQTVVWGVLMPGMQGITAAVMALAIVALLFIIDPFTAMAAASAMALSYLGLSLAVRRRLHRNSAQLAQAATQRVQTIQEGLGGIRDILLEQSQQVFEKKFRTTDYAYRRAQAVNNFINLSPRYVVEGVGIVLIAAIAVYLGGRPGGIVAALPVLGALALGAQRVLPLLQQAYFGWSSLAGNREMLFDVIDLMRAPVVTTAPLRAQPSSGFQRELVLANVTFQYHTREYALREVNLRICKGARVGFVGETGSGKSTLLDLIMGLLEPTSGRILVDSVPLTDCNRALWQAQIAHVPQAVYLSDSSVATNIAFGEADETIDMERVWNAARTACIHDFIATLPQGYGTPVGERGVRLSGGQRQRIGIARALYKRAPVLIFDEATSALDDATEKAIMRSISELGSDVTLLMIAHRTSTLEGCDMVIRLSDGRIAEIGSYHDVVCSQVRS
jgi:ATP-binding cassette, subfamily B, bacterial PglK